MAELGAPRSFRRHAPMCRDVRPLAARAIAPRQRTASAPGGVNLQRRLDALLISPFNIEPELTLLARNGYRMIGQRWTALCEEDGRIAMLHLPGSVERVAAPRLRNAVSASAIYNNTIPQAGSVTPGDSSNQITNRLDLTAEVLGSQLNHAFCDAVFIVEPGRRPAAHVHDLGHSAAMNVLRRSWPIVDLMPRRRSHQLSPRLANHCRCAQLQLSRNPGDLLRLLDTFRQGPQITPAESRSTSSVALSLYLKNSAQRRPLAV